AVDDHEVTDTRARQQVGGDGAERTAAEHERRGGQQFALPGFTEAGQEHLAVVAVQVLAHALARGVSFPLVARGGGESTRRPAPRGQEYSTGTLQGAVAPLARGRDGAMPPRAGSPAGMAGRCRYRRGRG